MHVKNTIRVILILAGVVLLVRELALEQGNVYWQSLGLVCLMSGLFLINSKLPSKKEKNSVEFLEEEE